MSTLDLPSSRPGELCWTCRLVDVLKERYRGSDEDPSQNLPLYMTGPEVLVTTVQRYLNLSDPVSGFINKLYEARVCLLRQTMMC